MGERRQYNSNALYQRRTGTWRWVAAIDVDELTESGKRKRVTVTGPGCVGGCAKKCPHRAAINRKLKKAVNERKERGESSTRTTVKAWADEYLAIRVNDLSPKGYNAAVSPIRKWIVPTIGNRRLADLTPKDVRAVHDRCRAGGKQPADVHRALHKMLNAAVDDGHYVAARVLKVKEPKAPKSDRAAMTVPQGLACLQVASELEHGTRWLFTLLYGARMGECLGLTWDAIDLDAGDYGEVVIEWQLQALPYRDRANRDLGFRVPDGHESRHLVDAFHLVRPKTKEGYRVAPLLPVIRDGLLRWREVAPPNPWGLVWPAANGRPANDKHDRAEWWALQETAGVTHPTRTRQDGATGLQVPAPYHVHECRNFAATMLLEAGVDDHIVTALLGHSTVVTSRKYMTVRREPLLDAMRKVGERLQLG